MEEGAMLFFTGWLAGLATILTLNFFARYSARRSRNRAFRQLTVTTKAIVRRSMREYFAPLRNPRFYALVLAIWAVAFVGALLYSLGDDSHVAKGVRMFFGYDRVCVEGDEWHGDLSQPTCI